MKKVIITIIVLLIFALFIFMWGTYPVVTVIKPAISAQNTVSQNTFSPVYPHSPGKE